MALKLKIITASTRPGRIGPIISNWTADQAKAHGKFDVEIVDLADERKARRGIHLLSRRLEQRLGPVDSRADLLGRFL